MEDIDKSSYDITEGSASIAEFMAKISEVIANNPVYGVCLAVFTDIGIKSYQFQAKDDDLLQASKLFKNYPSYEVH